MRVMGVFIVSRKAWRPKSISLAMTVGEIDRQEICRRDLTKRVAAPCQ